MRSCGWTPCRMEKLGRHVWCELLFLCPYLGYPGQDFDWADYLKQCGAEAAPQRCFPPVRTPGPLITMLWGYQGLLCLLSSYGYYSALSLKPNKHLVGYNKMVQGKNSYTMEVNLLI